MATSSNQSGFVDSWQRGKSVTECNLYMLDTEDMSDVTFLVGPKKHVVRAHRYVLASRSCVFHAMFCGRMAEQGEITIPDVEVNVFKDFLRFLYTDNTRITTVNVTGLMYTARKYDVETLFVKSTTFIENSLSEENLCEILEESHGYGETDLEEKALEMLRSSSSKVTKSPAFLELCPGCFGTFLKSENLNLEEEEIFEAALSWTKQECERQGLSPNQVNMRKVLGELVYEIRFPTLSLDFLTKVVGPSGILTGDERVRIVDRTVDSSVDISPFKYEARKKNIKDLGRTVDGVIYTVKRFRNNELRNIENNFLFGIAFSTNKNITLLGCQVYGAEQEEMSSVCVEVYDNQRKRLSYQETILTLSRPVSDIVFPDPVFIQAGRVYTICIDNDHCSSIWGLEGQAIVRKAGVEFTFTKSKSGVSCVHEGQIPGLIWRF